MRLLGIILLTILAGCGRVETGEVGVRIEFNKQVEQQEVPQGFYFAPLSTVEHFSVKEIEIQVNDLSPKAADNLFLRDLDMSVYYRATPEKVADLFVKYQGQSHWDSEAGNYLPGSKLLQRLFLEAIFDTIADYDSLTIHTRREEISREVAKRLQDALNSTDPATFTVTRVTVRQMLTDPALEESIQQTVQMQKQTERKLEELNFAKAEADRQRIVAQGMADADRIRAAALTPEILKLKELEVQQAFAQEGTHTVLLGGQATPLVNVK